MMGQTIYWKRYRIPPFKQADKNEIQERRMLKQINKATVLEKALSTAMHQVKRLGYS